MMRPEGMPDNYYFGGGSGTLIAPLSMLALLLAVALIFVWPRRYIIIPLLAATLTIPLGNQIVVSGVHFMSYRLLLLATWMRIAWLILLHKNRFPRLNRLDKVFLAWALVNAVTFSMLWGEWEAVINRLGFLYSTLGAYFLLRYLIRTPADVLRTVKTLAIVMAVIALSMVWEQWSGNNSFSMLGGVDAVSAVRNGRIRAQGPFAHSIIAGTCGAMLLPVFFSLRWYGKNRWFALLGVTASTLMTLASASATPVATYVAGAGALCAWPIRRRMRSARWTLLVAIVALHLVMKAPVWFLIGRMSSILGGSGWHRAQLVNQFIRHADEWWLIGTRNSAYWGLDMWDAINAYVSAGVNGGFLTLSLFITVLVLAYKSVGQARASAESRTSQLRIWALGAGLFANTVGFFGIVYFDQSAIVWYALLVMISALAASSLSTVRTQPARSVSSDETLLAEYAPPVLSRSGAFHG